MNYTPEQTKEHRKELSDALRSGKYQQRIKQLTNPNRTAYCCLGVACEISGLGEWRGHAYVTEHEANDIFLPRDVKIWLGFTDERGGFQDEWEYEKSLSHLNDMGATFSEIADLIDSEPQGLIAV